MHGALVKILAEIWTRKPRLPLDERTNVSSKKWGSAFCLQVYLLALCKNGPKHGFSCTSASFFCLLYLWYCAESLCLAGR